MPFGSWQRKSLMPVTVLYPEERQIPDDDLEREIFGSEVRILRRPAKTFGRARPRRVRRSRRADDHALCRYTRGPRTVSAAARNILVCNVPDYGTTEVADHVMALALSLRRGVILYHERQRQSPPGPVKDDLIRRLGVQTFGIIGLGRIGTAVTLRGRAFGFRVMFFDPHLPNGAERTATLEDLLRQTDNLSVHTPLTPEIQGMLGYAELASLRKGAVVVNTAREPIIDLDALLTLLRNGHIAAAGLDGLLV